MRRAHASTLVALAVASVFAAVGSIACSSGAEDASPQGAAGVESDVVSSRISRPAAPRVVAIGDLHGDVDVARSALRLAGAIDERDRWIGGNLVVVQTGDEVDRGAGDRAIVDLTERLKREAKQAGGELIALVGNHELMNTVLDFRYVTDEGFAEFADVKPSAEWMVDVLGKMESKHRGRAAAFLPGGPYAKILADRPLFMKVGDDVFVHGGILPKHLRYGLDTMNDQVRGWVLGSERALPEVVSTDDGPLWVRDYSESPKKEDCDNLEAVLEALHAKRMIIGHTVQKDGINPACGERAWRIDVGLSSFYGGKLEILEIKGDALEVLRGD